MCFGEISGNMQRVDFAAWQHVLDFLSLRQTFDIHPLRRLPAGHLFLLIGANFERARRHTVVFLQHTAHPQRDRIEVGAHADHFSGKVFRFLNAARAMNEHVAVAKLTVRKNRDRAKRRAPSHPAEKHAHLQLADVEFQIAGKPSVALFRRQRQDFKIDAFRLHGAVDEKSRAIVFVAGQG